MKTLKFLLLGVTGDLAKRKILPAIGQFASMHKVDFGVELIGYSRSVPDSQEIVSILSQETNGISPLTKLSFVQGQYEDVEYYYDAIKSLGPDDKLVVYLAVPPQVFVPFLKNSCPYSALPIDILIEKPFGRSLQESQQMLDIIAVCDLHQRVHFLDHYNFKSIVRQPLDQDKLTMIKAKTIKNLDVLILEELGLEGRAGYYNDTGAIKDILIHSFTLANHALKSLNSPTLSSQVFEVDTVQTGQYSSYLRDTELQSSSTETYYNIRGITKEGIHICMETGKKLGQKLTQITATFTDETKVVWNIAPNETVVYTDGQSKTSLVNMTHYDNKNLDHVHAFEDILHETFTSFVTSSQVIESWKIYDEVVAQTSIPKIYQDRVYPVLFNN